jgi:hypothetical protein
MLERQLGWKIRQRGEELKKIREEALAFIKANPNTTMGEMRSYYPDVNKNTLSTWMHNARQKLNTPPPLSRATPPRRSGLADELTPKMTLSDFCVLLRDLSTQFIILQEEANRQKKLAEEWKRIAGKTVESSQELLRKLGDR